MEQRFEGELLDGNAVTIRQYKGPIDVPLIVGEKVRVTIVGRVAEVAIQESRKDGRLIRNHTISIEGIENPDE